MQHKVTINRVEKYSMTLVVEADSKEDAVAKVKGEWEKDDDLLHELTENYDDTDTQFDYAGKASEEDRRRFINL